MGKTGYKVSEIGFGAMQFGGFWATQSDEDSIKALNIAAEKGVNFIDTAGEYGDGKSERIIRKFIKSAGKRIYISTKTQPLPGPWPPSPYSTGEDRYPDSYIRSDVDERLKNLGVNKLDILLLHTWTRRKSQGRYKRYRADITTGRIVICIKPTFSKYGYSGDAKGWLCNGKYSSFRYAAPTRRHHDKAKEA